VLRFKASPLFLAAAAFYAAVQALAAAGILGPYALVILDRALIFVILVASLNLINGILGQFSLGHMGFAAVGAYVSGLLTLRFPHALGTSALGQEAVFLGALAAGSLAAAMAGFLIGFPCLRLKGDYLAVATLGFAEIIRTALNGIPAVGGPRGLLGIPRRSTFTLLFLAALLTVAALRNLIRSPRGRALLSVREDELAAAHAGVDIVRTKVLAFVLGACLAGLAGGLLAHLLQMAHPTQFGFTASALLLVMVYAGGAGSLTGSVLAAFLLTFLTEGLRLGFDWLGEATGLPIGPEWAMVLYALLLVVIMLHRPEGLMGGREAALLALPEEP
jgi:branched-chain amino acid transport system permease protein